MSIRVTGMLVAAMAVTPVDARVAMVADSKAPTERLLVKEAVVDAPRAAVWNAWTTSEGLAAFFTPDARVEMRIGGPYELYMGMKEPDESGLRGTEGCTLLSFIPEEMLAFEWNFPPAIMNLRKAGAKTQIVLQFKEIRPERTQVRLVQLGWQKGEDWDAGFAYFDRAWGMVLSQLSDKAAELPKVKSSRLDDARTWTDGRITITAGVSPRWQTFEMDLDAPLEAVWRLLSTEEGFSRLGGKNPKVELQPGGAYSFWPGAPNRVMAYVPGEVLATTGSAPPKFPNVRKGGTWSSYFLEPTAKGGTRLRLVVVGWQEGEEWESAFDYFLKANPEFLAAVRKAVEKKPAGGEGTGRHGNPGKVEKAHGPISDADLAAIVDPFAPEELEFVVNGRRADVWNAFATTDGLASWLAPHVEIDLRIGGKMRTNYNPKGELGDPGTIENTVLSFEPERMLSIRATKPPDGFPFKEAIRGAWTVIYFENEGMERTRIRMVGLGYSDSEESKRMRLFFRQGNAWTGRQLQRRFGSESPDAGWAAEHVR